MRFNRNVSVDDMKEMISTKIVRRCGKRISKLFYKFSVSINLIKFTEMELVDDDDVETMVAFYCVNRRHQNALIQLFVKLADVETIEYSTPLGEEHGVQDPCTMVPININLGPILQIHLVVFETDADGDDEYNNSDPCDHEVVDYSNPDLDEVLDDIDDEGAKTMKMLTRLNFEPEGLFVGQKFATKEECIFVIKRYNMNVSVDYKIAMSKPTLYIRECWRSTKGFSWRV
ncbi:hypothetical protein J1N35_035030 [Gossypium stocksii]|uniref:Transposase MuDR plant domain-containing protein n=1 Tax=Gossypium stocksii TaxID=47602 RepID=A0A9D3ZRA1_9ROSI|nr:hypothetical protein J1N35_035030 [Gossypium stocksii]